MFALKGDKPFRNVVKSVRPEPSPPIINSLELYKSTLQNHLSSQMFHLRGQLSHQLSPQT